MTGELTWKDPLFKLQLPNKEELVTDEMSEGILGCSNHRTVEYKLLRGINETKSSITTLDIRRKEFELLRDLLGRIPKEIALEIKGAWENCLIFTAGLLRAQEHSNIKKVKQAWQSASMAKHRYPD